MTPEHRAELMALADRVVVLNFGRKIAQGTPAEVQRDAAVVSAYLGDINVPERPDVKAVDHA